MPFYDNPTIMNPYKDFLYTEKLQSKKHKSLSFFSPPSANHEYLLTFHTFENEFRVRLTQLRNVIQIAILNYNLFHTHVQIGLYPFKFFATHRPDPGEFNPITRNMSPGLLTSYSYQCIDADAFLNVWFPNIDIYSKTDTFISYHHELEIDFATIREFLLLPFQNHAFSSYLMDAIRVHLLNKNPLLTFTDSDVNTFLNVLNDYLLSDPKPDADHLFSITLF